MSDTVTRARDKAPIYVGYYLVVTYTDWSQYRQQFWCANPPDELWEAITSDQNVAYATLTRRRRKFRTFNRRLEQAATAPLNHSNRRFVLMR